jgi:hypothetical protein
MPQGKFSVAVVLALLIVAPILGEYLAHTPRSDRCARRPFDFAVCPTTAPCAADFDGDGVVGSAQVVKLGGEFYPNNRALLVVEGEKELLWLPFHHPERVPPTRLAVRPTPTGARLLASDMTRANSEAAFVFDGARLVMVNPSEGDERVFGLMNEYGEDAIVGGLQVESDRIFVFVAVKLFFYYLILMILAAVMLYRRTVRPGATTQTHFLLRGNP